MKVLYRQNREISDGKGPVKYKIGNCHLKEIINKNDYKKTSLKYHYHIEYEIHMVYCGKQCYEVEGTVYEVDENEFIIIPPCLKHRVIFSSENLLKYSLTFAWDSGLPQRLYHGEIPDCVRNSIEFISEEYRQKALSSAKLIENRVFETIIVLARKAGYKEEKSASQTHAADSRIDLAKKFISDNVERNLSVSDVAAYCHISPRQLARGFMEWENISPAKYINNEKMKKISECVKNTDLSLRRISEMFSYNNEYYFNHAFKKHFGMPPMTYRKMYR